MKLLFPLALFFCSIASFGQTVYSVDSKYDAKKKIYFCDSKYDADLIIYFTDSKYDAGWRSNAKKSVMY